MSNWGVWGFRPDKSLPNQRIWYRLSTPRRNVWAAPVGDELVVMSFTYGSGRVVASGLSGYLVLPLEEPYDRLPWEWLYESPDYVKYLNRL
ncbi:TPA: hypothetical protein EYP75_05685 [Candidatus Bathyarchaeota archaeon]|nr:hypothetical protein [Candidatus Bathyarchaeota archaeon]